MSLAWISDTGPRDENQDRAVAHLSDDGSWLVAVADGLGGHPRGAEAAEAAISSLPSRVIGKDGMHAAFRAAHQPVFELAPVEARRRFGMIDRCPATTLCAAAWTPAGWLVVGMAGDTLPVLVWRDDSSWRGRLLCSPHRSDADWGYLTRYLGAPLDWPWEPDHRPKPMTLLTQDDIAPPSLCAVVILSDGVWEALIRELHTNEPAPTSVLGEVIAGCLDPGDDSAEAVAERIMNAAREAGLDDNGTVAVAHVDVAGPTSGLSDA